MITVPGTRSQQAAAPKVDPKYLMMAAADMHANGMLLEKPKEDAASPSPKAPTR